MGHRNQGFLSLLVPLFLKKLNVNKLAEADVKPNGEIYLKNIKNFII
jgi:hypothetical protein